MVEEDVLRSGGVPSSGKHKLQFVSSRQKATDYVKMQTDLSLSQEGHRLCGEESGFQQGNAANDNASITKNYTCLNKKNKLLGHPACFPEFNLIENLWGLDLGKDYEGGQQDSLIFEPKNAILDAWEKCLRFNFRNDLLVCLAYFRVYQS